MAKAYEVLEFLRPDGGYAQSGEEYEGIQFLECEPFTKKEWEEAFAKTDAWLKTKAESAAKKRQDILNRLGLTEEEFKTLIS